MKDMNRVLSSVDIEAIYQTFVRPKETPAYLNNYRVLPTKLNDKRWKWEGKDSPRIIALLEFRDFIQSRSLTFNDALSFNGADDPEYEYVRVRRFTITTMSPIRFATIRIHWIWRKKISIFVWRIRLWNTFTIRALHCATSTTT
jgi:hypothetical protein